MRHNTTNYRKRRETGSMLVLCIGTFVLIGLIVGLGFSAYNLFFADAQLRRWSENVAVSSAQGLNVNDHTGKLNCLTVHARELVYLARQMHQQTQDDQDFAEFGPLAAQVLQRAREGAEAVGLEREQYLSSTLARLKDVVKDSSDHAQRPIEVFNLSPQAFSVEQVRLGCLNNSLSNVEPSEAVNGLFQFDSQKHYMKRLRSDLCLYRAALELRLPAPDDDLHFRLSPAGYPVEGTTDPLRLTESNNFQSWSECRLHGPGPFTTCEVMPSAVQVVSSMRIESQLFANLKADAASTDTACTNGASPEMR